ncbi:MAG: F0F1 ATP synthase subunit epsilon [bacterium]|nr:F0F1 ATP synthase subunit epsilon [bacterium]
MADKIALDVVTPERRVLQLEVDDVMLPSVEGYMGVLPGHAPLLAMLDIGELSYKDKDGRHYLVVTGGYAEVLRERVTVLARTCERAEEIDVDRAKESRQRAEQGMSEKASEQAFSHSTVKLRRAVSRIQVHGRLPG